MRKPHPCLALTPPRLHFLPQLTIREFEQNGVRVRDGTKLYLDQNRAKGMAAALHASQAAAAAHPAAAALHQQQMMGGAAAAAAMAGAR